MPRKPQTPRALTIAGSDSGGGAGIQADLKTFAALGVYGTSAITAVTAQNTRGVTKVQALSPAMVEAQIDAVVSDIGADAVKTGMLANARIIRAVASKLREYALDRVVIDPVMVAASGARLLAQDAVDVYKTELFPLATVVTPNILEAEALLGARVRTHAAQEKAARSLHGMGPRYVIVKGGHLSGDESTDVLFDGKKFSYFSAPRVATTSNHGTGCTFASAIAAGLAKSMTVEDAVGAAKTYVTESMRTAFPVGNGHGPLNHMHGWWKVMADSRADASRGVGSRADVSHQSPT